MKSVGEHIISKKSSQHWRQKTRICSFPHAVMKVRTVRTALQRAREVLDKLRIVILSSSDDGFVIARAHPGGPQQWRVFVTGGEIERGNQFWLQPVAGGSRRGPFVEKLDLERALMIWARGE